MLELYDTGLWANVPGIPVFYRSPATPPVRSSSEYLSREECDQQAYILGWMLGSKPTCESSVKESIDLMSCCCLRTTSKQGKQRSLFFVSAPSPCLHLDCRRCGRKKLKAEHASVFKEESVQEQGRDCLQCQERLTSGPLKPTWSGLG